MNRQAVYKSADVFMICVSANTMSSFNNIDRWRGEIDSAGPDKQQAPKLLILTKSDLLDELDEDDDNRVDFKLLVNKNKKSGFQGVAKTSSKVWEDFNVHKAFTKTLVTAFKTKFPGEAD